MLQLFQVAQDRTTLVDAAADLAPGGRAKISSLPKSGCPYGQIQAQVARHLQMGNSASPGRPLW